MLLHTALKDIEKRVARLGEIERVLQEDLKLEVPQEGPNFKFLTQIFDSSDNIFVEIVSREFEFLYFNPTVKNHYESLGYKPEVGKFCYVMIPGEIGPCVSCSVREAFESKKTSSRVWVGLSGRSYWSVTIPMMDNGLAAVLHLFFELKDQPWNGIERRRTR